MKPQDVNNLEAVPAMPLDSFPVPSDLSAQLAMEIATELCDASTLMKRYGMSGAAFKQLLSTPAFANMVKEAKAKWDGDMNANERIRVKSAIALEDSIIEIHGMIHDKENPSSSRIEAAKTLGKFAKADAPDAAAGSVPFVVNINLGDRGVHVETLATPKTIDAE